MLLNENEEVDAHQSFGVKIRFSKDDDVDSMLAIYIQHIRRGLDPNSASSIDFPQIEDLKRRCFCIFFLRLFKSSICGKSIRDTDMC